MDSIYWWMIIFVMLNKKITSFSEVLSLSSMPHLCRVNHFQDSIFLPFMIWDFENVSLYKMLEDRLISQELDIFDYELIIKLPWKEVLFLFIFSLFIILFGWFFYLFSFSGCLSCWRFGLFCWRLFRWLSCWFGRLFRGCFFVIFFLLWLLFVILFIILFLLRNFLFFIVVLFFINLFWFFNFFFLLWLLNFLCLTHLFWKYQSNLKKLLKQSFSLEIY